VNGGADLVLSELDEGFVIRVGTDAGAGVVETLQLRAARLDEVGNARAQVAAVRAKIGDPVAADGLPERLRAALDHPRWDEVAERCLACANCTLVCPTCFCTSVGVASDLDGIEAVTERSWDSCFSLGFGRVAGDANFRPKVRDRYRQWLTHKFSTWWDQFGSTGCVGCGRCIAWCPVGIDVREELSAIAPPTAPIGPIPWPPSPAGGRAPAPLGMVVPARHVMATVASTVPETRDTVTLRLETADEALLAARPGQFVMVELPAFAAPPISISRIRPDGLDLTIRSAGPATAALTALPPGAQVGLRGPLGRGWPIDAAIGRDVIVVAGGIGLAPLRPLIEAVLADRPRFGAVRLYVGARTPHDRLFVAETSALAGRADIEVDEIVDRAGPEWLGRVGIVTQLFDQALWDGSRVTAFVCGPERMMQATAAALEQRGVEPAATWLTLERNMACGVGTCGHCQLGPFFVCRDGPVFSMAELGTAFETEGL
jgi:NAD(P)H-flavin reductase